MKTEQLVYSWQCKNCGAQGRKIFSFMPTAFKAGLKHIKRSSCPRKKLIIFSYSSLRDDVLSQLLKSIYSQESIKQLSTMSFPIIKGLINNG